MKTIEDLLTYRSKEVQSRNNSFRTLKWGHYSDLEFKQSAEAFFRALVLNSCNDVFFNDGGKRKNVGKVGVMNISNFDSYYFWTVSLIFQN